MFFEVFDTKPVDGSSAVRTIEDAGFNVDRLVTVSAVRTAADMLAALAKTRSAAGPSQGRRGSRADIGTSIAEGRRRSRSRSRSPSHPRREADDFCFAPPLPLA